MKTRFLAIPVLAALALSCGSAQLAQAQIRTGVAGSPQPSWAPAGGYAMVFDDEFSGTAPDPARWNTGWFGTGITGPVNSMELARYSSANVTESGGYLNLALAHTAAGGRAWTGAIVTTLGKFTFTYGEVEWRAYLPPSANGLQVADWPALWADGTGRWPSTGEMDVMEGLGGIAAAHFISPSGNPGIRAAGNFSGWHTFGAWWQRGKVTYYYDGKAIGSITRGITGSPMYLIMDNTLSARSPLAGAYPAVMQIDWVRVWH